MCGIPKNQDLHNLLIDLDNKMDDLLNNRTEFYTCILIRGQEHYFQQLFVNGVIWNNKVQLDLGYSFQPDSHFQK